MTFLSLKDRSFWFKFSSISDDAVGWRKHGFQKEDQGLAWIKSIELIYHLCPLVSANHPSLQPGGWIAKAAAHQDRPNACERRLKGCRQTVMYDPGVQYPSQMLLNERWFWSERKNRIIQRQALKSGRDRLKPSTRAIAQVRGASVEHNVYQTSPGKQHWDTRMITRSDINPAQQDLTSLLKLAHTGFTVEGGSNFRVCRWNPEEWPFQ